MYTIAVVDDDVYIGDMLERMLKKEGYEVLRAYSGTEALLLLSGRRPDLILLDLMLPGLSGEEVLSKIRDIPVIVVSAKADVDNKVDVLLGGAADYVTKPFDIRELLARITVRLRKGSGGAETENVLKAEELEMDANLYRVYVKGQEVHLTRTEFAILKQLMQNPAQVVTKSHILDAISEDTPDCTESSLKIHVSNLRKKLKEPGGRDYIETVWGIGFKLRQE